VRGRRGRGRLGQWPGPLLVSARNEENNGLCSQRKNNVGEQCLPTWGITCPPHMRRLLGEYDDGNGQQLLAAAAVGQ